MTTESAERLWSRAKADGTGCWVWQGGKVNGYGRLRVAGRVVRAHRVAYELVMGPIPEGLQIDHLCRNRACVNPAHLEAVTQQENIARGEVGRNNASKTHCPRGHAYDSVNTYRGQGKRQCRACHRERQREYVAKQRVRA